jgi:hypothetical protein
MSRLLAPRAAARHRPRFSILAQGSLRSRVQLPASAAPRYTTTKPQLDTAASGLFRCPVDHQSDTSTGSLLTGRAWRAVAPLDAVPLQREDDCHSSSDQTSCSCSWASMVDLAACLTCPQLPDSYIQVGKCSAEFVQFLVGVAEVAEPIRRQDLTSDTHNASASLQSSLQSLVVDSSPDGTLDDAACQTVTQILTGQLPNMPVDLLLALFQSANEPGDGIVVRWLRSLGQQDSALSSQWAANKQLQNLEPLRCQMLQWMSTRHHFPIRAAVQPYDVAEVGPQVVWALVWLHHHVLGALRAWGEGMLSSRQLAGIYEVAGRCVCP